MSRLWKQGGAFRTLAIFMLVLGVMGGVFLGTDRVTQQRSDRAAAAARIEADELQDLQRQAADGYRDSADERNAQRDAQQKADAAAAAAAAQAKAAADAGRGDPPPASRSDSRPFGPIPSSCSAYKGNQAIGCALLDDFGFGLDQMPCLVQLWNKESGWNVHASNPSGAYGIPQANPGSKMSTAGPNWHDDAATQIRWGLGYIKGRYQTPCGAWSFWQSHHWY